MNMLQLTCLPMGKKKKKKKEVQGETMRSSENRFKSLHFTYAIKSTL